MKDILLSAFSAGVTGANWECLLGHKEHFKPIYAIGSLLPTKSFMVTFILLALFESAAGLLINKDHKQWDYSKEPFNIEGQICFIYTFLFTLVLFAYSKITTRQKLILAGTTTLLRMVKE